MRQNIDEQLATIRICSPHGNLHHVGDEEDDECEAHKKDHRRQAARLQLILPLDLAWRQIDKRDAACRQISS